MFYVTSSILMALSDFVIVPKMLSTEAQKYFSTVKNMFCACYDQLLNLFMNRWKTLMLKYI